MNNEQLNYWVAKAHGWSMNSDGCWEENGKAVHCEFSMVPNKYSPSTNWKQAGELIEKYKLDINYHYESDGWECWSNLKKPAYNVSPQRAICMAVIASVFGEEWDENL